jgi:hypothetical protein
MAIGGIKVKLALSELVFPLFHVMVSTYEPLPPAQLPLPLPEPASLPD